MTSTIIEIDIDGRKYSFDGSRWYDSKTFEVPRPSVLVQLNAKVEDALKDKDSAISDLNEIIATARIARTAKQVTRFRNLATRAFEIAPDDSRAIALCSSALREAGEPEEALRVTDQLRNPSPAVLTSRAAALCDLQRWEEAKTTLGRALAKEKSEEAFAVVHRIKAARPDLYDK